jgi:hypothetical protein
MLLMHPHPALRADLFRLAGEVIQISGYRPVMMRSTSCFTVGMKPFE